MASSLHNGDREVYIAGGEIASTFDKPESVKLGSCKLIEEIMIGEDKLIHFSGVEMGEACTIILRGASKSSCFLLPFQAGGTCEFHVTVLIDLLVDLWKAAVRSPRQLASLPCRVWQCLEEAGELLLTLHLKVLCWALPAQPG